MLRLPPGLRDKVAARAAQNDRSMNTELIEAIEHHLQGADRITRLWEFYERHRESMASVPLLLTAIENLEMFAERSGDFHGVLQRGQEAAQPSVTGEPAERLKAAIEAMRTHSRAFEERIRATKREEQKEPPEVSDRRASRLLRDLGVAVALELLIDHRERARGFSEAFAQDEVRLILQLAAPKIVQQSDRLVSEPPHIPRLRLPCAVGCFLLHNQFDRIRAELRCGFFENRQKIVSRTRTADVFRRRFASHSCLYEVLCMVVQRSIQAGVNVFKSSVLIVLGNPHHHLGGGIGV
jgi:Arc-like DNA binding domain